MEPDSRILSLSKLFVIEMLVVIALVAIYDRDNLTSIIGSGSVAVIAMFNYGLRRVEQRKKMENNND